MSENIDELRNMLVSFRVSELQMLLGFAGRNRSGRKTELQQRALELLRVRSHPIHQKIRDLYKAIQQSGSLTNVPTPCISPGNKDLTMPRNMDSLNNPYGIDNRQLSHRSSSTATAMATAMYNSQSVYNPYPQYTQPKSNQSSSNNLPSQPYPIHPDVKFRRLPFFDIISDLLKPSTLMPQSNQRMQEATFYFHLTPQQATDIASSRDIRPNVKCDYIKQVQLRFCLLETTCEQDDFFPPSVIVKVNGKPCPLPNPIPTNKPGVEPKRPPRPVNITQLVKLSPLVPNTITVSWAPEYGRGYAISVALVQKLTSQDLLQRLRTKGAKHSDHTRALIKEKLKEDADSEITTTCVRVSLICPLGKMRMTTPCRAITCNHLQCFDSSVFLQMNERKPTWCCPVCDKPALYDNLVIDGYFQEVLASANLPLDLNEIQLNKDGSWSSQLAEPKLKGERIPLDDSIEIIGDDIELVGATSSTDSKLKMENNIGMNKELNNKSIVDLTCTDSEDDEPLAKRRVPNPKPDSTIKFSDITSISSSSNHSRVTTTPGPSSVSSSGYPASPSIITLDSPSPPRSPNVEPSGGQPTMITPAQSEMNTASCMMTNTPTNGTNQAPAMPLFSPGSMPFLDLESEALGGHLPFSTGY